MNSSNTPPHQNFTTKIKNSSMTLEPAFGKNAVAIMMAADENYAPIAGVMLKSIIDLADKNRNYDITIIGKISEKKTKILMSMARQNIAVRVVDIKPLLKDFDFSVFKTRRHFTIEAYYRFFIPKLFSKYEKVLYLDVDMIAFRDVAELYDTEIGGNWWAASKEAVIQIMVKKSSHSSDDVALIEYLKNTLNMDNFDYFNSGVMLWNIRQCVKNDVCERLVERLAEIKTPLWVDQCVMNSLANGKNIHWLSNRWNAEWHSEHIVEKGSEAHREISSLIDNAFILHFTSGAKPWNNLNRPRAEIFWQHACQNPFFAMIMGKHVEHKLMGAKTGQNGSRLPKWLGNLICCFIPKRKNRRRFRKKYIGA
ncbi:MAG: glycosyltransferase family 8 protein [Alphaproteobacteria bacterium]|nr:glycosyltransferase family 8 protein [Alphaproteobacteria bacterium]